MKMTQQSMLARYSILHELGRGATGAVYAARARSTGEVVALKRLDPAHLDQSDHRFTDRVLKQLLAARHLSHRNIVHIAEASEAGGTVYVAMEMLEGASLRRSLDDGPLAIARAIQIAHDIARGLAYAHLEAVVHARLKPSNIMVLPSGLVKITDFGIGQLGQAALLSGAQADCLRYLSPEQLRGDAVDHRCDLFSLGALFYEMLAQRAPFEGRSPKEITQNILRGAPRPPSELNPHVPRALDTIVLSMLATNPADRMAGAPVLVRELQRLQEALGLDLDANAAGDEPTARTRVLRRPDASDLQDHEPRFEIRPELLAAEAFEQGDQVIDREVFDVHRAMMQRESTQRASRLRPAMFAALGLVLAVLYVGLTGFMGLPDLPRLADLTRLAGLTGIGGPRDYLPSRSERLIAASTVQEAPVTEPAASHPTVPAPAAEEAKEALSAADTPQVSPPPIVGAGQAEPPAAIPPTPLATEPGQWAQPEQRVVRAPEQPASASTAPPPEVPRAMHASTQAPRQQRDETARVMVSVSPRGELYIDGKHHGTTPPITTFNLTPGLHRIEVRSGSRKPYLTYMTIQAGEVRRIRHDFNARPIRPPG